MPVVSDNQVVTLHQANGVVLYEFSGRAYSDMTWTRNQRDISTCDMTIPPGKVPDALGDIAPWVHWLTVWDADRTPPKALWTGPIFKPRANRAGLTLAAKDHAAYLSRTRNPFTYRWDATDPAVVAGRCWEAMLDQKGIEARPIVRPDPEGRRYDFQMVLDDQLLDQTMNSLVDLGLRWSVVSGVPILGPLSLTPLTTLSERDFLGDGISLVRDGTATYNDVIVRGQDTLAQAKVPYYGQVLQTIKDIDSMSGVSNVNRAAWAWVTESGVVRTRLELDSNTVLHPDAPVSIDELMPSTRFVVDAYGVRQLMELTGVSVNRRAGAVEVKISMETALTTEEKLALELDNEVKEPIVTLGTAAGR